MKLIVGLGNPGEKYQETRHNLGFMAVSRLADRLALEFSACSFTKAYTAEGQHQQIAVSLLMPQTFMNRSGIAVKALLNHYDIALEDVLIVCDDLTLPFRQLRLRTKGSDGGNNGLKSIIEQLGSTDFARLRMGISKPAHADQDVDHVLSAFSKGEQEHLPELIDQAAECCLVWASEGPEKAMERFNQKLD